MNTRGITFITLRRRTPAVLREMALQPRAAWRTVHLDVPHRLYQTPKVIDQRVRLHPYGPAPLRQLFIKDLGHEQPTVLLTNDLRATPSALIIRYARRMLIENGFADAVNVLHLDALSSAVALNVSFDVRLTTIATGLYRLLALKLHGFERAQARQIWRRFLKSPAHVRVTPTAVVVELPRRARNPILIASGLLDEQTAVPWWNGRQLRFEIPRDGPAHVSPLGSVKIEASPASAADGGRSRPSEAFGEEVGTACRRGGGRLPPAPHRPVHRHVRGAVRRLGDEETSAIVHAGLPPNAMG